jgi:hypothetical protein
LNTLFSVWFPGAGDQYPRMARVLAHTARLFAPTWSIRVEAIPRGALVSRASQAAMDNSWKLEHWARAVEEAPDGAGVLLLDADTFVTAPLDPLWGIDFDFAYTVRDSDLFPLNGGVVAVRANERSRAFMRVWQRRDREMLRDLDLREPWRRRYGGQNQAALGSLLEGPEVARLDVARLPCWEWNCEDLSWRRFGPGTRIVHVHSALRATVFHFGATTPALVPLAALWRRREREAAGAAG